MCPRLVCWLPVVDEVRTRIYSLSREFVFSEIPTLRINDFGETL